MTYGTVGRLVLLLSLGVVCRPRRVPAEDTLPEVVVTEPGARSPAEPGSASTLTREDIEGGTLDGTRDLSARVPGLSERVAGDRKSPLVSFRGLANTFTGDTAVGLYVDDLPYANIRGQLIDLYDVDRIDVLRGPQTTRFGRAAEVGAIDVVTSEPGARLHGDASVRYGNYDTQVYRVAAGGPVWKDTVGFTFAGLETKHDGYVRNTFLHEPLDDRDLLAGRARLIAHPLPRLEIALSGEGSRADDGPTALVPLDSHDPFKVVVNTPGKQRTDGSVGGLTLRWAGPDVTLRSITVRRWFDSHDSEADFDVTPAPVATLMDNYRFTVWSEELHASSADPTARWRWHAGGFFEDEASHPDTGVRVDAMQPRILDRQFGDIDSERLAAFGRSTFMITPTLELTGGLRYEHFQGTMHRQHTAQVVDGASAMPAAPPIAAHSSSNAWLPHAQVAEHVNPALTVYASATRGYRSGGFSHLDDDAVSARFRPEFGWTYETGVHASALDGRLDTDVALYWIRVRDYQDIEPKGLTSLTVRNARHATSRGVELEVFADPIRGLDLEANVAYIDAHYDDFREPGTGRRFDGNRIAFAPQYTFWLGGQYRQASGLVARVEYQGLGAYPFFADNLHGQAAYELVNARLGYEHGPLGVYVYGKNLADSTYFTWALHSGPPFGFLSSPGDPRTFGVMVAAKF